MPIKILIFLSIGTLFMFFPIWAMGKKQNISAFKCGLISVILTLVGTLGTMLMYYIETGSFGGISFFGAVFVVPIVFSLVAIILRVPYGLLLDMCAVGECLMSAVMKVHCYISGCCKGRPLFETQNGTVYFPSRMAEMLMAIGLFIILFVWFKKGKKRNQLYAWYLVLYGSCRFCLNWFRELPDYTETLLPMGNIWSIVAVVCGLIWILVAAKNKIDKQYTEINEQ